MHPPVLFKVQPSLGDQHVNVGVEVYLGTEGVEHHDDARDESAFFAPFQHGLSGRRKQNVQEVSVPEKDIPKRVRDGEHDMAIGNVEEFRHRLLHPLIRHHFPARRAKP